MRLIDPRNIASKRYEKACCDDFECGWNACINEIMECVQQIEAEPVRHGRWVYRGDGWYCTVCKKRAIVDAVGFAKYCPRCGAKMDAKEDCK